MRKVSRTLAGVVLATAIASAPAAPLHARPAEEPGRTPAGIFDRLHDLLHGQLTRLWTANEATPSFDPNGGQKAKSRTGGTAELDGWGVAAETRRWTRVLRTSPRR